jgi:hypothetical protein
MAMNKGRPMVRFSDVLRRQLRPSAVNWNRPDHENIAVSLPPMTGQRRIVAYGQVESLKSAPQSVVELVGLLSSILDRAYPGGL